jgi:hypothetical protein
VLAHRKCAFYFAAINLTTRPKMPLPTTTTYEAEAMAMLSSDGRLTLFIEVKGEPVAQPRVRSHYLVGQQRIVHFNPCQAKRISFSAAVKASFSDFR